MSKKKNEETSTQKEAQDKIVGVLLDSSKPILQKDLEKHTGLNKGVVSKDGLKLLLAKKWIKRELVKIRDVDTKYKGKVEHGYLVSPNLTPETLQEIVEQHPNLIPKMQKKFKIVNLVFNSLDFDNYFVCRMPLYSHKKDETVWTGDEISKLFKELFKEKLKEFEPDIAYKAVTKTIAETFDEYWVVAPDEEQVAFKNQLLTIIRLSPSLFKQICSPDFKKDFQEKIVKKFKMIEYPYAEADNSYSYLLAVFGSAVYFRKYAIHCLKHDIVFSNIEITPEVRECLYEYEWEGT